MATTILTGAAVSSSITSTGSFGALEIGDDLGGVHRFTQIN